MKNIVFLSFIALSALFMTTNCAPQSSTPDYAEMYQSYVDRMTKPVSNAITLDTDDQSPCEGKTLDSYNCLTVVTNGDAWKNQDYNMAPLDGTTATSDYQYTITKGSYSVNQYSGDFYSQSEMTILLTCSKGYGHEVDHTQGWAVITFKDASTQYNSYEGAQCRFGTNDDANTADFNEEGTSNIVNQVNCECPSVLNVCNSNEGRC